MLPFPKCKVKSSTVGELVVKPTNADFREATEHDIVSFLETLRVDSDKIKVKCKDLHPYFSIYCINNLLENKYSWRKFVDTVKEFGNFKVINCSNCIYIKGISLPKDASLVITNHELYNNNLPPLKIIINPILPRPLVLIITSRGNDIKNDNLPVCKIATCGKEGIYGYEGRKHKYCLIHKLDGMVISNMIYCKSIDCNNMATHGELYSNIPTRCKTHSDLNCYGYDQRNPVCCVVDCVNTACFLDPFDQNIYPIRCSTHKFATDMEIVKQLCVSCQNDIYFPMNKKICMNCGLYRSKRLQNFKENIIKYFLQSNHISVVYNRSISHIGSKYRPDFLIISNFGYIILEVDENQHRNKVYASSETDRMLSIYYNIQTINKGSEVLFIRYNPDKYQGIQHSPKERHTSLHALLLNYIRITTIGTALAQIRLYYDGFNGAPETTPINVLT